MCEKKPVEEKNTENVKKSEAKEKITKKISHVYLFFLQKGLLS